MSDNSAFGFSVRVSIVNRTGNSGGWRTYIYRTTSMRPHRWSSQHGLPHCKLKGYYTHIQNWLVTHRSRYTVNDSLGIFRIRFCLCRVPQRFAGSDQLRRIFRKSRHLRRFTPIDCGEESGEVAELILFIGTISTSDIIIGVRLL